MGQDPGISGAAVRLVFSFRFYRNDRFVVDDSYLSGDPQLVLNISVRFFRSTDDQVQ